MQLRQTMKHIYDEAEQARQIEHQWQAEWHLHAPYAIITQLGRGQGSKQASQVLQTSAIGYSKQRVIDMGQRRQVCILEVCPVDLQRLTLSGSGMAGDWLRHCCSTIVRARIVVCMTCMP